MMVKVKTQILEPIAPVPPADVQRTEASHLEALTAKGLILQPKNHSGGRFQGPRVKARGKLASEMVIEDRR